MNILKILGIVVAIHVVAFFLMFVNPGCRSTSQGSAPLATDTVPAGDAVAPSALNPATAPADSASAVSVNIPSSAVVRYSPTRPGTPAASARASGVSTFLRRTANLGAAEAPARSSRPRAASSMTGAA